MSCPLAYWPYLFHFILHLPYFHITFMLSPCHPPTNSSHTAISPEQACTLVHHPLVPLSLGLSCPNLGFHPHLGLSYPSGPLAPIQFMVINPSSCCTQAFVLSQQAC